MTHTMRPVDDFVPEDFASSFLTSESQRIEGFLEDYGEALGLDIDDARGKMKALMDVKVDERRVRYLKFKAEGRANSDVSRSNGIVVYVVNPNLVSQWRERGVEIPEPEDVGNGLFRLELPNGVYSAGGRGIQFYLQGPTEAEDGTSKDGHTPFVADYNDVLRIEGLNSPTAWQNRHYNWDGTPK